MPNPWEVKSIEKDSSGDWVAKYYHANGDICNWDSAWSRHTREALRSGDELDALKELSKYINRQKEVYVNERIGLIATAVVVLVVILGVFYSMDATKRLAAEQYTVCIEKNRTYAYDQGCLMPGSVIRSGGDAVQGQ